MLLDCESIGKVQTILEKRLILLLNCEFLFSVVSTSLRFYKPTSWQSYTNVYANAQVFELGVLMKLQPQENHY